MTTENLVCPVDNTGKFKAEISDFEGIYVKDADKVRLISVFLSRCEHRQKERPKNWL